MTNDRNGHRVNLSTIAKVEEDGDYYTITKEDGWTFGLDKDECNGFVPHVNDWILTAEAINNIAGVIIEGHVIRYKSAKQVAADHEQFKKDLRLKRLEEYVAGIDDLKARVAKLHPALRARMERFAAEDGIDFWIENASYEMYAVEGTNALLNKVDGVVPDINGDGTRVLDTTEDKIKWIEDWWALNTKEHDYDYKRQMALVPDFGDGHSGWTASAAKGLAVLVLEGKEV